MFDSKQPASSTLLTLAVSDIGEREDSREGQDNAKIVQWLRNTGIMRGGDETPWCSAWMYDLVGRVNPPLLRPTKRRAAARSWLHVGTAVKLSAAVPGDIVIFDRGRGRGHVGLFLRQQGSRLWVLGGNQGNRVMPRKYRAKALLGVRRLFFEKD